LISSIQSHFLDLTGRQDRYDAMNPKSALRNRAHDKVIFIARASCGVGQATAVAFAETGATLQARQFQRISLYRDLPKSA
jgi:hypothetical protein